MLAEEFHLPENRRIVVTDDMPACALSEHKFLAAAEEGAMQYYRNQNVAVFCWDPDVDMPEIDDGNWNEFCEGRRPEMDHVELTILIVRRMIVKINHGLQNGVICDKGLLHGFIAYRPLEKPRRRIDFVVARPFKTSKIADSLGKLPHSVAKYIKENRLRLREEALRKRSDIKAYCANSVLWKAKVQLV